MLKAMLVSALIITGPARVIDGDTLRIGDVEEARRQGVGMWCGEFVAPWEWRRR